MADNDWKKRLGVVFSTNPDFTYEEAAEQEEATLEPSKQNLIVSIDRKGRAGRTSPASWPHPMTLRNSAAP